MKCPNCHEDPAFNALFGKAGGALGFVAWAVASVKLDAPFWSILLFLLIPFLLGSAVDFTGTVAPSKPAAPADGQEPAATEVEGRLILLGELRDSKAISEEEFQQRRAEILAEI